MKQIKLITIFILIIFCTNKTFSQEDRINILILKEKSEYKISKEELVFMPKSFVKNYKKHRRRGKRRYKKELQKIKKRKRLETRERSKLQIKFKETRMKRLGKKRKKNFKKNLIRKNKGRKYF